MMKVFYLPLSQVITIKQNEKECGYMLIEPNYLSIYLDIILLILPRIESIMGSGREKIIPMAWWRWKDDKTFTLSASSISFGIIINLMNFLSFSFWIKEFQLFINDEKVKKNNLKQNQFPRNELITFTRIID